MSRRRLAKRDRVAWRELLASVADIGDSLLHVRDQRLWEIDGFASFDAYAAARIGERCPPAWDLTAKQLDEFVAVALELATKRRRKQARR